MRMNALRKTRGSLLAIGCAWALAAAAHAEEVAYWVWGKRPPVSQSQREELRRQGTRVLYRQVVIVDGKRMPDAAIATGTEFKEDGRDFTVIPVVRVGSREVPTAAYFAKLRGAMPALQGDRLQIDFDCPDRLLPDYATLLRELRGTWPQLSITALAHWATLKDFPELARSSGEICPMFYDLQRDPTGVSVENPPPPILDPTQVQPLLDAWAKCPVPWRAGLPVFSRVTIFDVTGLSRGQLFGWEWPELVFNVRLRSEPAGKLGVQLLRVAKPTRVAHRELQSGEMLAVRQTDPEALAHCRSAAIKAGAAGIVLFRLPDSEDHSTGSLRNLSESQERSDGLRARISGDALILENSGNSDLAPRLAGKRHDRDRGYALELDAPAAFFREAEPGGFYRVTAHAGSESELRSVPVSAATRLTFWISHLHAGASLRSGLFQLAPHADASRIRWRVGDGEWKPLISQ